MADIRLLDQERVLGLLPVLPMKLGKGGRAGIRWIAIQDEVELAHARPLSLKSVEIVSA